MKLRQTLGFFLLCLLSSATWLTTDLLPAATTPIAGEGFRLLLVGAVGLLAYLLLRQSGTLPSIARCGLVGAASIGLIGFPFLLLIAAEGKITSTSVVLVFAGMPILLIVASAISSTESGLRLLPAGLMGVAGLLILLPLQVPHGSAAILGLGMLVLAVVCTALCFVWLHLLLREFPIAAAVSLAGFANGILLTLVASTARMPHWDIRSIGVESLRCVFFDLPQVVLLLWLIKCITPLRLAARYLVGPFLTVVEGLIIMRPGFDVRTVLGMTLLALGAYAMLRLDRVDRNISLKLG